jgi:hypothetical protein
MMGGACSAYWQERGMYRVLVGKLRERDHWGEGVNSNKNYGFRQLYGVERLTFKYRT